VNTLSTGSVADLLGRLHDEAAVTDSGLQFEDDDEAIDWLARERADYKGIYKSFAEHFLAVSPVFGQFLYTCVRARRPERIVEFGSSMGISAIHLACGLRDNGQGLLIGTELEEAKIRRAKNTSRQPA
jgi:predicted O-methyltransferase YrrM